MTGLGCFKDDGISIFIEATDENKKDLCDLSGNLPQQLLLQGFYSGHDLLDGGVLTAVTFQGVKNITPFSYIPGYRGDENQFVNRDRFYCYCYLYHRCYTSADVRDGPESQITGVVMVRSGSSLLERKSYGGKRRKNAKGITGRELLACVRISAEDDPGCHGEGYTQNQAV